MTFNSTLQHYGFEDGSPFGGDPYYKSGPHTGMTAIDEEVSLAALVILEDRFELSADEANNWLDTGDTEVGYDFGQHMQAPNILADESVGAAFLDDVLGYGGAV
jgi:hypothetical protein